MTNEILRGYEIVNGLGVSVMKFKPTVWGAKSCAAAVKWLADRHPNKGYEMRAVVSVGAEQAIPAGPLHLEEDDLSQEEQLAAARVAAGEYDVVEGEPNVDG